MVHCTNRQKHSKPLVYQSSQVYQDCTNSVPIVKNSLKTAKTAKMTIGVRIVTGLPRLYQQCTNSVPIVKNSQKTVKTAKMTIGVPIVTCLPRLYQQCNNSVPIVKNSEKQSNSKKMTIGIPIVTCLHIVRRIHKVRLRVQKVCGRGLKICQISSLFGPPCSLRMTRKKSK